MNKPSGPLYEIIDLARGADSDTKQSKIEHRLSKVIGGYNLRDAAAVFASELVSEFPEASCAILGLRQITRNTILKLLRTLFPGAEADYSFLTEEGGLKIDSVDEVMVPTHGQQPITPGGAEPFKRANLVPRLQYLIEVLESLRIDLKSDVRIIRGVVAPNMIRRQAYVTVVIRSLEMIILVCDEEGNRTFVISGDTDKPEKFYRLNKDELNQLIERGEAEGIDFHGESGWKVKMAELLSPKKNGEEAVQTDGRKRRIVFVPKDMDMYASRKYIADLIDVSCRTVHDAINKLGLRPLQETRPDLCNGERDLLFPRGPIERHLGKLVRTPRANKRGVIVDREREYRTVVALAGLFGIDPQTVFKKIEEERLKPLEGRPYSGDPCDFYDTDDVRAALADFLALPYPDAEGVLHIREKRTQDDGTQIAIERRLRTARDIRIRKGVSQDTVARIIRDHRLVPVRGRVRMAADKVIYEADFYDEDIVCGYIDILLAEIHSLPHANQDGAIIIDGEEYRTRRDMRDILGCEDAILKEIIGRLGLQSVPGIRRNRRYLFYPIDPIRREREGRDQTREVASA